MAILKIRLLGDPILREKGRRVSPDQLRATSTQRLIDDMIETMRDASGAGLAAQQIGLPLRLLVIEHGLVEPNADPLVLINAEIVKCTGTRLINEGCLSIPGYMGEIERCMRVVAKGLDRNGKPLRIRATDMLAQALEHEIDHTNGILYIDHLESPEHLIQLAPEEHAAEAVIEDGPPPETS
ncbi:MAG: peptide deformylase [Dehalococcoidia bacterium]